MQGIAAKRGTSEPAFVDASSPTGPADGEVLCQTLQLGVCGTDREILLSQDPWVAPESDHLILGHECLGRVAEVGRGVSEFQPGDLVVPVVRRAIVESSRRADLLPFGQYVERGIVNEHGFSTPRWLDRPQFLFRVDPAIEHVAVLAEPLSVAEKAANEATAIQRGRLGPQAWRHPPPRVLVTGMGPIGFAAIIACRCRQWPVAMFGRDEADSFRAVLATSMGATYLSSPECDLAPNDVETDGFDLIIECTGSDQVMLQAANALASCGVMVWVGSTREPRPAMHNVSQLMRRGLLGNHLHIGTVNAAHRDFEDALQHLAEMEQTDSRALQSLITDRVVPQDSLWHYQHRRPQGIKTVLMYDERSLP